MADDTPQLEPLTDRQQAFLAEFLVDLDAAAAYRRAFSHKGTGARQRGHEMRTRPAMRAAIDAALDDRGRDAKLRRARIIAGLESIAYGKVAPGTRISALNTLAKIEGMLVERVEVTDKTLEQLLREIDPSVPDAADGAE